MLKRLFIIMFAGVMLVSCSSTKAPKKAPEPVVSSVTETMPTVTYEYEVSNSLPPAPVVMNHNSVYFAFNKFNIHDNYTGIIKANSDYLAQDIETRVRVYGNTDDIGSVEYNLSLGHKRAIAVKNALVANGANKSQIEAISNGKLKPVYSNEDDASRAQNRRVDIIYITNKPNSYSLDSNNLPIVDGNFYNGTVIEGIQ
jgi:peptidoglycan-associated lipoprotein